MGPPPDGLTQTAVGQSLRPKNRTAEEEKREKQQADLTSAQRLLAEARGMVEAVIAVGVKAVGEAGRCTACREPVLAKAGRFTSIVGISLTVWVIFGISNVNVQLCFGRFVCSNASRVPLG